MKFAARPREGRDDQVWAASACIRGMITNPTKRQRPELERRPGQRSDPAGRHRRREHVTERTAHRRIRRRCAALETQFDQPAREQRASGALVT
jgi:hypothetical protein